MLISATLGATASLSSAATSLAFASNTFTYGQTVVVGVSIPGTATVSSVTDSLGNTYTQRSTSTNGTTIRSELWTAPVTVAGSSVITISFSGSTLASAVYEEYVAGAPASTPLVSSSTSNG